MAHSLLHFTEKQVPGHPHICRTNRTPHSGPPCRRPSRFVHPLTVGLLVGLAGVASLPASGEEARKIPEKILAGDFQPSIVTGRIHGTPFSLPPWKAVPPASEARCTWYHLPAPEKMAVALRGGAAIEQTILIPKQIPGNKEFGGLLTVRILGTTPDAGAARLRIELLDAKSRRSLASAESEVHGAPPPVVPHADWKVTADSVLSPAHAPFNAVDMDGDTLWYTRFGPDAPGHPHFLIIDMGRVRRITGVLYHPRRTGNLGIVKAYAVYAGSDGRHWGRALARGEFDYKKGVNTPQRIEFDRPVLTRYIKFETLAEINGHKRASAAEIRPLPADEDPAALAPGPMPACTPPELCLQISRKTLRRYAGREVVVRIQGSSARGVVVDDVNWRTYPLGRHFNINHWGTYGSKGIYEVDVGPLGIEAISYPGSVFLPVMNVRDGSPAAKAGIRIGDVIIAVDGKPLPASVNRAVKEWTTRSHAAFIGRAIVAAQENGADGLDFTFLRGGRKETRRILLPAAVRKPFRNTFPFHDPQVEAMRRDILDYLVRTQEPAGCWHNGGNDYMQTSLAGLALLSTGDPKYAPQIKRAADYFLKKYKYPGDLVYLDFWCLSYVGWFLCEYHLATGDPRVIPWLKRMLDWLPRTTHMSWWDYPVWGHGSGGLPYGGKSLIAPTIHLYLFGSLARFCGVPGRNWDITKIHLFRSWSDPAAGGHGGIGYGPQLKDVGQAWSRTGMTGLALKLRGERPDMVAAITKFMDEHDYLMFNSHGYGTAGMALGLVALSQLDPKGFARIMPRWRWLFTLAWDPGFGMRYSSDHMGYAIRGDGYMTHFCGFLLGVLDSRLFLFGGRKRNWLDVSHLPTPLTPVEIRRDKSGTVHLECRLAGPEIRYTLDGTPPSRTSPRYTAPIPLPHGGLINARAFGADGQAGPISTAAFGESHASWKAESSNKSRIDPQQRWAQLAIDGDPTTWWQTDRSGRTVPPHWLILHFGKPLPVAGLTILPRQDDMRGSDIKDYAVFAGADGKEWGKPIAEGTLPKGRRLHTIRFNHIVRTPHLKLEVYSTQGDWCFVCAAEVDVIQPRPEISIDPASGTRAVISAPAPDLAVCCTLDGTLPTKGSPRYSGPVPLPAPGRIVAARCVSKEGWLGPPVIFRVPEVRFYDIHYTWYQGKPWGRLPDFSTLKPLKTGTAKKISLDVSPERDRFALLFTGKVRAAAPGEYTFYTVSDDGTRLFIDGTLVVDNDGQHAALRKEGKFRLDDKPHAFRLEYFDAGGADHLEVGAERPAKH